MSKIQIFESNSQPILYGRIVVDSCFRCQRYKFLKAIHNSNKFCKTCNAAVSDVKDTNFWKQFTTQYVDSNYINSCFRCQRYKFLKAIHNKRSINWKLPLAVSDVKDTNFWKQFTTCNENELYANELFPMSKIQIFESNSQLRLSFSDSSSSCFRCQRYKFLKAIHNDFWVIIKWNFAVSDVKDTNFWKQFTT